ncbi:class I SAM-dependent methyltransferase [Crocinitomicaceae bacterium CZZ-1]|uniref:Class I SAM-dependent methyltransferase n=1 Tax=Taishania pollutisoli TaxID=2766479 RepID=A0A8J6TRK0_9FLAO|nr:class I SAM-dependent methyltransferase [Taishania pollutisoli]MBC9811122.1 class I SAM-dependent methyltransferase [Taishania pollutisoli]NGF76778.1 class I SAM-dependent methyltransferase [Fluviicola sp. SGL-29]
MLKKITNYLTPKKVEDYYDAWTANYLTGFGLIFQSKVAENDDQLIQYYAGQMGIQDGLTILDAGCGVCGVAVELAKLNTITIDAVTISKEQVSFGKELVSKHGLDEKITVFKDDFHLLSNFKHNHYDIIYFMESLVHSNNPRKVIKRAKQLLKPDGVIYIKDLFEKTPYTKSEQKDIRKWVKHNNKHIKLNIIPKEKLLMILRKEGFQLEFCQLMKIPTNQDKGNKFVVDFHIMPDPLKNSLPPYLEWYEIKAIKPGPNIIQKM